MAHPPVPGPTVQPNFLAIMEALASVAFPISKQELLQEIGDATVIFRGRNAELHDIIKDLHDDAFASENEFLDALTDLYTSTLDEDPPLTEGGVLPSGPGDSWQAKVGRGDSASHSSMIEPSE